MVYPFMSDQLNLPKLMDTVKIVKTQFSAQEDKMSQLKGKMLEKTKKLWVLVNCK